MKTLSCLLLSLLLFCSVSIVYAQSGNSCQKILSSPHHKAMLKQCLKKASSAERKQCLNNMLNKGMKDCPNCEEICQYKYEGCMQVCKDEGKDRPWCEEDCWSYNDECVKKCK